MITAMSQKINFLTLKVFYMMGTLVVKGLMFQKEVV